MSTSAVQSNLQEQASKAIEALLSGFGIRGSDKLPVLLKVAENAKATSDDAFERVRLRSIGVEDEILAEEGGSLSDAEFAKRLNVRSRQTVHNYREAGKIFAVASGTRNFVYPALQIHKGALLPGLTEILRILHASQTSPMGILIFFLTPAEALEDERPVDLLRRGEIDEALRHAKRYDVIGS
jgi:hypothetical protein